MTLQEWLRVEALIADNWAQSKLMDREQARVRLGIVGEDLDLDTVMQTVVRMARSGREHPPKPGEIHAEIVRGTRPPAPTPGEVIRLLGEAAGHFSRDGEAGVLAWLEARQPHAARFVVDFGWRAYCAEKLDDPDFGGAVRQRVERSIMSSVAGLEAERREGRVRPLVERRLESIGQGNGGGGLRRLDGSGLDKLGEGDAA